MDEEVKDAQALAVEVRDMRVDYGDFVAADDISFEIGYGEIFGMVGPNGAGKTSTFNVLATLMEPTYGEVKIAGHDILLSTEEVRHTLGYMPDLAPVPSDLKLWQFLDFYADSHGLGSRRQRADRVAECLEKVKLTAERKKWCKELSRGQTQRLVLAKTLLHRPKVLILDEPASGLDPLSRRELRMILRQLAKEGATVLISSHILSELAEVCTRMCIMHKGRLLATGTAEEVRDELGSARRTIHISTVGAVPHLPDLLEAKEGVTACEVTGTEARIEFEGSGEAQAGLLQELVAANVGVRSFHESASSFEEILIKVAEGGQDA